MRLLALLLLALPAIADSVADLEEAKKKLDELDLPAAEAAIGRVIAAEPKLAAAYVARARLRRHQENFQGAAEDALAACRLGEDLWKWTIELATAAVDYRITAEASLGRYRKEKKVDDLKVAAESFASAGDFERAAELYGELTTVVPKDEGAEFHMDRGNLLSLAGDHEAGLKELDAALRAEPKFVRAYQLRGRVKLRMGDTRSALADYRMANKIDAGSSSEFLILGLAYYDTGNWNDAVNAFETALKFRNTRPYTYLYLFLSRGRTGVPANRLKAKKELLAYLEGRPQQDDWFGYIGGFLVGEVDEETLLKEAGKGSRDKQREQFCEAYAYIGQMALLAGDSKKAQACFEKVIATKVGSYMEYSTSAAELRRTGQR